MSIVEYLEGFRFLDIKMIDVEDTTMLLVRFLFNFLITYTIVRGIYYPQRKQKEYFFTFIGLNTLIFFVCYLMSSVDLGLGFGFGLFGLFAIMRYRTTTVPVKEMTYLFTIVAIAVVNAISTKKISYAELVITNLAIVAIVYFLEKMWFPGQLSEQMLTYEKIQNIKPENEEAMLADLRERTGHNVESFDVLYVDFLNDTAKVKIYYNA